MLLLASRVVRFPDRTARTVADRVRRILALCSLFRFDRWRCGGHWRCRRWWKFAGQLYTFYESSYVIFRPLTYSVVAGRHGLLREGVAYSWCWRGLASHLAQAVLIAIFIFSISTVTGCVSLPGDWAV